MFKPGDQAIILATKEVATVEGTIRGSDEIQTSAGLYRESELHPAVELLLKAEEKREAEDAKRKAQAQIRALLDQAKEDQEKGRKETKKKSTPKSLPTLMSLAAEANKALRKRKLTLDLGGHFKNGESLCSKDGFLKTLSHVDPLFSKQEDVEALVKFLASKAANQKQDRWFTIGKFQGSCSYCQCSFIPIETNGSVVRLAGEKCEFPNGLPKNTWELNVPSGKLVVANDLREWFPIIESDSDFDINTKKGCQETSNAYASFGLAHGFVSNTCPGVYKLGDGKYKIANEPSDCEWDEEKKEYVDKNAIVELEGEKVASICTDLWWYSICDFDEFQKRVEKFGGELDLRFHEVIDVKPGVYKFIHDDSVDYDSADEIVYTTFEWVREPDEVRDFIGEYEQIDINPHAYVQAKVKKWPTLYGAVDEARRALAWEEMTDKQKTCAWQRITDHVFFSYGNGVDWHEKGFPTSKVDPEVEDVDPPSFRARYYWYPASETYSDVYVRDKLTLPFANLLFRSLESVITFGLVPSRNDASTVGAARKLMRQAAKRYRKLAKLYPEVADPDYVDWLSQKQRAQQWIDRLKLTIDEV